MQLVQQAGGSWVCQGGKLTNSDEIENGY
jgi:hypothetical protein